MEDTHGSSSGTSQDSVALLLVDDDQRNLTALEAVLAAPDRVLVHARSGEEACRRVLEREFAVIVLDVNLPRMDGFETAELIRGRDRSSDTPIIFLTASAGLEHQVWRGYSLGAVDYLYKPFDSHILRSKVAVFVELFRKREEVRRAAIQLAEKARLEGALLAVRTAEHELGNQLAAVKGYLQLLQRTPGLGREDRERVDIALQRTQDAADTVQRLRSLAQLEEIDWGPTTGPTLRLVG